jgi:hypothetical protein
MKKLLGYYVMRDGEQIAWFSHRSSALDYARKVGGTIAPEYAEAA